MVTLMTYLEEEVVEEVAEEDHLQSQSWYQRLTA
jgi:hypothetical protein